MTIDEIIAYIMHTPENTNPAILRDLLTELVQGGDTSDFEYAKITVTNTDTATELPNIVQASGYLVEDDFFEDTIISIYPNTTKIINGVMYKKTLYFYITAAEKPTITGNITLDDEDEDAHEYTYIVSGNCSISAIGIPLGQNLGPSA